VRKYRGGPNPQCSLCNRFMSWADVAAGYSWTPYGGYLDLEPPDDEYAHAGCWESACEKSRELIARTAWLKPSRGEVT
jgi:hypothetical protein